MSKVLASIKNIIAIAIINIFNCFPIKNNKIFLFSYYGSQYGCSPKYISEYITKNYPKDKFDVVWAFNDLSSKEHIQGIRKVKIMSLKYFYELCTSKVIITNFRTTNMFKKRKNQYYIQTWHSSLRLKQIEKDAENSLPENYVKMAKEDSKKCDLLISGCRYSTEIFRRAFWYDGEIFESGTPSNDILLSDNINIINKVKNKLNIQDEFRVVLYAPTFRKDKTLDVYNLNYNQIIDALENKFGGKWILLIRLHPHLTNIAKSIQDRKNIKNVTEYDDVQELMLISDILITDYSSVMFSFMLTKKPCFLYAPDIELYKNNDRNLYFEMDELPFLKAENNEEMLKNISIYDENKYRELCEEMLDKIGVYDDGKASKRLAERLELITS